MPKASRIDPILHYSRRCRELEADLKDANDLLLATLAILGQTPPYSLMTSDERVEAVVAFVKSARGEYE